MEDSWKKVFNAVASEHYLMSKGKGTIIETSFSNENDVEHMVTWCKENVKTTWSYAKLKEYNYIITFRFFDHKIAELFKQQFFID